MVEIVDIVRIAVIVYVLIDDGVDTSSFATEANSKESHE
jgi:hypothetical protein